MRTAFIETLCEVATEDTRVWLLTGDLGFSVLDASPSDFRIDISMWVSPSRI